MRWFLSRYKAGSLSGLLPLVMLFIGYKIFDGLWYAAGVLNKVTFARPWSHWALFAMILLIPFFIGLLVAWQAFRELMLKLFSRVPVVSMLMNFFLNKDYVEQVTSGGFQEVIFRHTEDSWSFGTVTRELMLPENMTDGPLVPWVMILGPPTTPICVTAQLYLRQRSKVTFTGCMIKDTAIATASLGLKFDRDYRKFKAGA